MKDVYAFLKRFPEGKAFVDEFQRTLARSAPVEIRYLSSLSQKEKNALIEIGHDPDGLFGAYIEPNTIGNKNHLFLLTSGLTLADAAFLVVHEGQHRINRDRAWKKHLREEEVSIQDALVKKYGDLREIKDPNDQSALHAALGMDAVYGFIDEYQAYQRENIVRQQVKVFHPCFQESPEDRSGESFNLDQASERARLFQRYSENKTKVQIDAALDRIENSGELKKHVVDSQVPFSLIREATREFRGFEPKFIRF
jgi:hypothetical protein